MSFIHYFQSVFHSFYAQYSLYVYIYICKYIHLSYYIVNLLLYYIRSELSNQNFMKRTDLGYADKKCILEMLWVSGRWLMGLHTCNWKVWIFCYRNSDSAWSTWYNWKDYLHFLISFINFTNPPMKNIIITEKKFTSILCITTKNFRNSYGSERFRNVIFQNIHVHMWLRNKMKTTDCWALINFGLHHIIYFLKNR